MTDIACCYALAQQALLRGSVPDGSLFVYGWSYGRNHGWLELPDGQAWDPITGRIAATPDDGESRDVQAWGKLTKPEVTELVRAQGFWGVPDEWARWKDGKPDYEEVLT